MATMSNAAMREKTPFHVALFRKPTTRSPDHIASFGDTASVRRPFLLAGIYAASASQACGGRDGHLKSPSQAPFK
jgi:hypothetical protein